MNLGANKSKQKQPVPLWTPAFIACNVINISIFLSFQLFPPMLPVYLKSLDTSDAMIGWVGGAIIITSVLSRPFAGWVMDNLNRRKFYLAGMLVLLASTAAYGLFPFAAAILIIRLVHGLGWSFAHTGITTITAGIINKRRFAEGMAFFSLASSIALSVAPALALSISYRHTIMLGTAFILFALIVSLFFKDDHAAPQPKQKIKLKNLYEKAALWPAATMFLINAAYGAIVSFIAIYAATKNIANMGIFFTVYALVLIFTRPVFGRLVDRFGFNPVILTGILCALSGMVIFSLANTMLVFLTGGFLFALAFGASQTSLQAMALLAAGKDRLGTANATFFIGFDGGIGCGSIAAGILASYFLYSQMFLIMAGLPLIALALYFIKIRRRCPVGPK